MGQLLNIADFKLTEKDGGHLNPHWYFTDVDYHRGQGSPWWKRVTVETDFPYSRAIHWTHFDYNEREQALTARALKLQIRRFVERHCLGCVVFVTTDMSYQYLYRVPEEYRSSRYGKEYSRYGIRHGYLVFNFEEESDATLFELKFAGKVSQILDRHPNRDDVTEESIAHAKRESWEGGAASWS